ncbi:hypothetical protein [Pseudobutyrivibrio ruminis]|uniref:hypothetical protein n=1 Tax=Pseudobutyrivibrio ruminis TaxID=46206 RepID=UPI000428A1A0|nr:hypothetical protein [Pseudobutyrivibrio ruminis]
MSKKYLLKQVMQWLVCIIAGFFIANIVCFVYERPVGWHDTPCGATGAVREPGAILIHGTEGYSVTKIDRNGYTNPDKELADNYVLMMGASHTQGKEISTDKKYSVLVDNYLSTDDKLHTYNISCDGNFLPAQIKHFKAAMQAFPNASIVTIEIPSTDYSVDELENAAEQPEYNCADSSDYFSNLSYMEKIKNNIKDYVPLISLIKNKMETSKKSQLENKTNTAVDYDEYARVINKDLRLIRSEFDKKIVFIYHPDVKLEENGNLTLVYSDTWVMFKDACVANNIDIIDSGNDFCDYFEKNHKVPYGFFNTSLGNGHLNEVGHKIIADEVIEYLEDNNSELLFN